MLISYYESLCVNHWINRSFANIRAEPKARPRTRTATASPSGDALTTADFSLKTTSARDLRPLSPARR